MGRYSLLLLLAARNLSLGLLAWAVEAPTKSADAEAFFESHPPAAGWRCWGCHGPDKQKGNVRLSSPGPGRRG